jgi:ABC-2 type transport system permease protein
MSTLHTHAGTGTPRPAATARPRSFWDGVAPLTRLHARELVRDRRYFWFALLFPFGMLGMFLGLGSVVPSEPGGPDFTQTVVPMGIFLAVTSTALTVTAGPLAGLRAHGLLRLLGTTPVGRARLVLTHLVTRIAMVVVQLVALMVIAVVLDAVSWAQLPSLFVASLLGLAMFLGVGYLIGGRLGSPDAATNLGTMVQLAALFLSGLAIPLWLLPDGLGRALGLLPTTFFADLLTSQTSTGDPTHEPWLSALVVATTAVVTIATAIATFRWDQEEQ